MESGQGNVLTTLGSAHQIGCSAETRTSVDAAASTKSLSQLSKETFVCHAACAMSVRLYLSINAQEIKMISEINITIR